MSTPISDKITVYLRIKPTDDQKPSILEILDDKTVVTVPPPHAKTNITPTEFSFSHVFDDTTTQEEIFNKTTSNAITSFLAGKEALFFAYGVTCSGKTFTIQGPTSDKNDPNRGIIPRTVQTILKALSTTHKHLTLKFSMLELYDNKIRDLLVESSTNLRFLFMNNDKTQGYAEGQKFVTIPDFNTCQKYINEGCNRRKVSSTALNSVSSRSHCIYHFQLWDNNNNNSVDSSCLANMSIIDLAGSERSGKNGAENGSEMQGEAIFINQSLGRLRDLATSGQKTFREDVLTKAVSRYYAGTAQITIICNVNPQQQDYEESLQSLRWASVAQKVRQQSRIQGPTSSVMGLKSKEYEQLKLENKRLQSTIATQQVRIQQLEQNQDEQAPFTMVQLTSPSSSSLLSLGDNNNNNTEQIHLYQQTIEKELMKQFRQLEFEMKNQMTNDYVNSVISQIEQLNPNLHDIWNANTGRSSGSAQSYDDLIQIIESSLTLRIQQMYQNEMQRLITSNDDLTNEYNELQEQLVDVQQTALLYHKSYVELAQLVQQQYDTIQKSKIDFSKIVEDNDAYVTFSEQTMNSTSIVYKNMSELYNGLMEMAQKYENEIEELKVERDAAMKALTSTTATTTTTTGRTTRSTRSTASKESTSIITPMKSKTVIKESTSLSDIVEENDDDIFDTPKKVLPKTRGATKIAESTIKPAPTTKRKSSEDAVVEQPQPQTTTATKRGRPPLSKTTQVNTATTTTATTDSGKTSTTTPMPTRTYSLRSRTTKA